MFCINKRKTGSRYEEQAAAFLEKQGLLVIEKNFRCKSGEIDLIARDGRYLVFVEVKYRRPLRCGTPAEAVDARKRRKIVQAAALYAQEEGLADGRLRFDIIEILPGEIRHIEGAFDATDLI